MLIKDEANHLIRGTKLVHRLGMDVIFLSRYPMVEGEDTLECRYLDKFGEFKTAKFYREELGMA